VHNIGSFKDIRREIYCNQSQFDIGDESGRINIYIYMYIYLISDCILTTTEEESGAVTRQTHIEHMAGIEVACISVLRIE
jgi:hypothetical protein